MPHHNGIDGDASEIGLLGIRWCFQRERARFSCAHVHQRGECIRVAIIIDSGVTTTHWIKPETTMKIDQELVHRVQIVWRSITDILLHLVTSSCFTVLEFQHSQKLWKKASFCLIHKMWSCRLQIARLLPHEPVFSLKFEAPAFHPHTFPQHTESARAPWISGFRSRLPTITIYAQPCYFIRSYFLSSHATVSSHAVDLVR
jgi:hypothetical protein